MLIVEIERKCEGSVQDCSLQKIKIVRDCEVIVLRWKEIKIGKPTDLWNSYMSCFTNTVRVHIEFFWAYF